jgi:CRP-like cAMP-binding protein
LFQGATIGFLHQLALSLKILTHDRGHKIITKGTNGNSMYIILYGIAEVVSEDGRTVYAELGINSFFGEVALFFEVPRTATVRAQDKIVMFELTKEAFQMVMSCHLTMAKSLTETAAKNYELSNIRSKMVAAIISELSQDDGAYGVEATEKRLTKIPMFKHCDKFSINAIALSTSIKAHKKDDIIITMGEITGESSSMYIVVKGSVQIISGCSDATVHATITEGGFFGEVGLLMGILRTASIKVSSKKCELIQLTGKSLASIAKYHPESYNQISLEASRRLDLAQSREQSSEDSLKPQSGMMSRRGSNASTSTGSATTKFGSKIKNMFRSMKSPSKKLTEESLLPNLPSKLISILELDETCLYNIFQNVPVLERVRLRLVCKTWAEGLRNKIHWERLELFNISSILDQRLLKHFCKNTSNTLMHLNLKNCFKITDAELKGISLTCVNVKQLSISNCWYFRIF